ncbi:MAG: hypothetical protein ABR562_09000 [Thermoplasmatota archaeon]
MALLEVIAGNTLFGAIGGIGGSNGETPQAKTKSFGVLGVVGGSVCRK